MKKTSTQGKKVHIHFDQNDDFPTQDGQQITVSEMLVKRQNQLLRSERHQSIIKKPKIDHQYSTNGAKTISRDTQKVRDFTTIATSIIGNHEQSFAPSKEEENIFQQQALKLLNEFLFHPNRNNQSLINNQIAYQWILSAQTSTKIKSFLILYMILYKFEEIQFKFRKVHEFQGQKYRKQIFIEKKQKNKLDGQIDKSLYEKFKQNQQKKYISEYLEWLISKNERLFEVEKGNAEFWAMALNKRQQFANQLINSKNTHERNRNIFLSKFLMNAQDPLFRSTIQPPKQQHIIINMSKQDLERLPQCHWILGVNFSVRYFFKKPFGERVRQSLNPNNISNKLEIQQFYHEYQLLCKYFGQTSSSKNQNKESHKLSLADSLLQWISFQSDFSEKNQPQVIALNKFICTELLERAVHQYKNDHEKGQYLVLTAFELFERQGTLKNQQKQAQISKILYGKSRIAFKFGKHYTQIISKLQHRNEAQIPPFFQLLNMKYNKLYRHLLLSQNPVIKIDFLAQLKYLIEIDISQQNQEVKQRIRHIITSFNIITHWNKNVLKVFVYLVGKYFEKLEKSFNQKGISSQNNKIDQLFEIKCLLISLKIRLRLQPLSFKNLENLCDFIESTQKGTGTLQIEQKTVHFIKNDILSILFNKNQFNESLFIEIKKSHVTESNQKKFTILDRLAALSKGVEYFEKQISLLKQQASLMTL